MKEPERETGERDYKGKQGKETEREQVRDRETGDRDREGNR